MLNFDNHPKFPEHMKHGIELYVNKGIEPGGFMRAVLENDLVEALAKADHTNILLLLEIVQFMFWEIPASSWGDPEAVSAWIQGGGLEGHS
jgi:hypothetical protein